MIGVVARIAVKEGQEAAFVAAANELVAAVKTHEPDTLVYQCFRARTNPRAFVMLEVYKNQAALDAHQKTAHFAAVGAKMMPTFDGMPALEFYDAL